MSALVTAPWEDDDFFTSPEEIDPVFRAVIDAKLSAASEVFGVTEKAKRKSIDTLLKAYLGSPVL